VATKLIVTGLSDEFTEACLYDLFDLYGSIVDVELAVDPAEGGFLGHGFVVFEDAVDAARARVSMDGAAICGRTLHVHDAETATPATPHRRDAPAAYGEDVFN